MRSKRPFIRLSLRHLLWALIFINLYGCLPDPAEDKSSGLNKIIVREAADANSLHPLVLRDAVGFKVALFIYQSLVNIDYESESLVGILAKGDPTIDSLPNQAYELRYQLRPEAQFDNGRQIKATDILFSLKYYTAPFAFNRGNRGYYQFIDSVKIDQNDPLAISFYTHQLNSRTKFICGDFFILPYEQFDPQSILSKYTFDELKQLEKTDTLPKLALLEKKTDSAIKSTTIQSLNGSGPYALLKWEKGKRILLEKKSNWWAAPLDEQSVYFQNKADQLQLEIIADETTAISALKSGNIDVLQGIGPKNFEKLQSDSARFQTYEMEKRGYQCIGFNMNHALLQDKHLRKAIAHLCPLQIIVDQVFYGKASVSSVPYPIESQSTKDRYPFNPEKAKSLLEASAWKDVDNDGILEKKINGEMVELELEYLYNTSNASRAAIGMILKQEAKKVGINIQVQSVEWSVYLERLRNANTALFYYGAQTAPLPPDFSALFHSKSAFGGRNFAHYQSSQADALINTINQNISLEDRNNSIEAFYEIIQDELPYYFMLTPYELIATSTDVKGLTTYIDRPYYWASELYK